VGAVIPKKPVIECKDLLRGRKGAKGVRTYRSGGKGCGGIEPTGRRRLAMDR